MQQSSCDAPSLGVIVPLLNEVSTLPSLCQHLVDLTADQIVIVDGGSDDGSWEWLEECWSDPSQSRFCIQTDRGRAQQMNAGASQCGSDLLVFLHADTRLPKDAVEQLSLALAGSSQWGRFDVSLDSQSGSMRMIAWFINWRSRLAGIATGDQAMFVERELFWQVGGFESIPLMEDVALSKSLKQVSRPACLHAKVISSARRWQQNGVLKTVFLMWGLRLAYALGVSPARLARSYQQVR